MTASLIIQASSTHLGNFEPLALEAVEDDTLQVVPLVGTVSAGEPVDMYEEAEDHIRLQPASLDMEPLILRQADVEVLGVVKVIVRRT